MATIQKRKKANGTLSYTAQIRLKSKGKIIHHESKTFDKRKAAEDWAKNREVELKNPQALVTASSPRCNTLTNLLHRYIEEVHPIKPLGVTKRAALERMQRYPMFQKDVLDMTTADIIDFCRYRNTQENAGKQTINADISYLRTVVAMCKPAWNIPVCTGFIDEAKPLLRRLNLLGASNKRRRRLENNEYDLLIDALEKHDQDRRSFIPLSKIFRFSIFSMMRLGEVCRITWNDLNREKRTIIVRQRKDPTDKASNDQEIALLGPAWDIINDMPIIDERIFPYVAKSITNIFRAHVKRLEITDLRYHDLRREGISRLIELGFSVEEIATVSGHKNLRTIWEVYTKINTESLHSKYQKLTGA